jgi:hypothetical protein
LRKLPESKNAENKKYNAGKEKPDGFKQVSPEISGKKISEVYFAGGGFGAHGNGFTKGKPLRRQCQYPLRVIH